MRAKCPRCRIDVNPGASVCPACKTELALCSFCRDLTTLETMEESKSRWGRRRYVCDKCGRVGARCRTALVGGYCNGLARADGRLGHQLCAGCTSAVLGAAKTVAAWTLIGALGSRLRPRG